MKRLIKKSTFNSNNDYKALLIILEYVYSGSHQRKFALKQFSSNINSLINSSLIDELPLDMKVTRWYDFDKSTIDEVYNQIENNNFYQYPYNVYSFSKLNSNQLKNIINKDYGLVVEKDLSNINGYYIDVHNILTWFNNESNFRKFLENAMNSINGSRVIDFFIDNGILRENINKYNYNNVKIYLEELAYIDQQEIIIISDDIGKIYKNEIINE